MSINVTSQPRFSVSNSLKQFTNSKTNINYKKYNFIDLAKKLINKSELVESEYYISLSLLSSNLDINDKITILSLKSFIYFKTNDEMLSNSVLRKIMDLFEKRDKINRENHIVFIRIFYRAGMIFYENRKYFLALQCFFHAKNLLGEGDKDSETKDLIKNKYFDSIKEIERIVENAKTKIFKKEEYIKNLKLVASSIDIKETNDGRPYYLISTLWLSFFLSFLKHDMSEKLFDINKVCLLNFCDDKNERFSSKKYQGRFPGPINNFHLLDFKNFWFDPDIEHQHTNFFLKHNVKENTDFTVVTFDTFDKLQCFFGCNYSIQRNSVVVNDTVIIDVYLKRFKIFVYIDTLFKSYKNHLCIKEIQFGKSETVLDLKKKLIRCLNYVMNEDDHLQLENCEFKIYIPLFDDKKNEIIRLIFTCSNNEFFTFCGEEIKNEDEYIYNLKISPQDLVLVEIKINPNKQWLLHLQKEFKKYNCFYCKEEIEEVIRCNFCVEYYYCSNSCRSKDENHIFYHININNSKKDFKLDEISSIDISKLLDNTSAGGLAGLKNLGNTCFMNSAIQCLSHAIELTLYFLLNKYTNEINKNNQNGTKGKMAEAYYELIKELWLGNKTIISPWDFRQIFVSFSKQFAGFSQQDSQEMLVYVLDYLHEDLSRVKEKPYIEIKEKEANETEEQASKRWWQSHLKRESSIIVDLFHGQFKSEIKCLKCGKISITFDPFSFLGLPIPNTNFSIKIKFFYKNPFKGMTLIDFIFTEQSTVNDLKENILNKFKSKLNLIVMLTKDLQFKQILKDSEVLLPFLERNDFEVIVCQTKYSNEDHENKLFICSPSKMFEQTSFLIIKNEIKKYFMYPRPFVISKELKVIDLYYEIFKYYRNILPDLDSKRSLYEFQTNFEKNDEDYLENEFNSFRKTNYFKLFILNNISESSTMFVKQNCEFCGQNCESCNFNFSDNIGIEDIYNKLKNRKIFILVVHFQNCKHNLNEEYLSRYSLVKNSSLTVYDCVQAFREGEKLEKENAWYCSNCKKHQDSLKKMDIYKYPKILIIHLKRFKSKSSNLGFIQNQKNMTFIDYPLLNLNLLQNNDDKSNIYDLFAVSCHVGSISSGHYTAICNNRDNWYMFDDSSVYKVSTNSVISESAYLLFYRKK